MARDTTRGLRSRHLRALVGLRLGLALALALGHLAGINGLGAPLRAAEGATAIAQTYYTPFEAQQFIDVLRSIAGDSSCCDTSVESTISITSGADGNTVVYDHFEDGFEADPFGPDQASTVTLSMDSGDVWTQTSSVPIDQPGRGAGNYYDGRDKIVSVGPIAVTQAAYASDPGTVHAGAVQVLDIDKSGLAFDIPAGEEANYNGVFDYVGLTIVGTGDGTTVQIDADADGVYETTVPLAESETYILDGGVNLGAGVIADKPVSVYVATGDNGATYEGRFFELYPTSIWSDAMVSPVGSHSGSHETRVFLFNPEGSAIDVDVTTGGGGSSTVTVPARGQGTYLMPVDQGARFASRGGESFYGFQAITTEGSGTSAYDWAFTLIPEIAVTPSVIVPYGPGSQGLTRNYSPVWIAPNGDTTLFVDRDGDPTTGPLVDGNGDRYDFSCVVSAYQSVTVYDDGTTNCYPPSQSSDTTGGGRDMTGARLYSLDGARLSSAWGQRPNYTGGSPALDMGTTILPFPAINLSKSSVLSTDADGDGFIDPGDRVTYTISMLNLGIVDVGSVLTVDETPIHSTYVAGSTTLDGVPEPDDPGPFSPSPLDADSPAGGLAVGTIPAGSTRVAVFTVQVDDPLPIGVRTLDNLVTMTTQYGSGASSVTDPLDVPPLQIDKTSSPSASPVPSGATIDYTIRVFNGDIATQTGVSVADTLPSGTTYQAGSVAAEVDGVPVAADPPPLLVDGVTLEPGSWLTITLTATTDTPMPAGTTQFVNEAAASSSEYPVPVTDNAVDTADPRADLRIVKVDDTAVPLNPGDRLTYTITVDNDGPDNAAAVEVVDTLPSAVTFNAGLSDPACVEGPVGEVTCALGNLAAGAGATFDIVVDLGAGASGTLTNEAVVSSGTPDPDPSDNSDTEDTPVDALPSITVAKTPSVGLVPEPGGTVTFTVDVGNASSEAVTLTALTDDVFGDLLDAGNGGVSNNTCPTEPVLIPFGGVFTCTFDADLVGDFGDPDHQDTVTATVDDGEGTTATGSDDAVVSFGDQAPTINVWKIAGPGSVPEPGGTVTFTIEVDNTSSEAVTLTALTDDVFGDLLDAGNGGVSNSTCPTEPVLIPLGGVFTCTFDADLVGDFGDPDHQDTVTATVDDGDGNFGTESGSETVGFDASDGELIGHLFIDTDGDGVQDGGEPDLSDVDVVITDADGTIYTVTSNTDGDWSVDVALGEATLAVDPATVPGGHVLTTANAVQTAAVPLGGAASDPIGYRPEPASFSGTVFLDLDGDFVRTAPEPGLAGVTVRLLDGSGVEVATTVTNGDGGYGFGGLGPGSFTVEMDRSTVPGGLVLSGDPDSTLDWETTVALVAGEDRGDLDFVYEGAGSIGDTVWLDSDEDGVEDPGEGPIPGVVVELTWTGFDGVFGTSGDWSFPVDVTGSDGMYGFWDLPPGEYRVGVDLDTVTDDLVPTTPVTLDVELGPGDDFDEGDVGFAPSDDAPLPQTGIEAAEIGLLGLILAALGLILLLLARIPSNRHRIPWHRL